MNLLGMGLSVAGHLEDALSVKEAELSLMRRVGASDACMLATQGNIANTYQMLGRHEQALQMRRDVYSGYLKLNGGEHGDTVRAVNNYAHSLLNLRCFEEAKSLLRKTMPVARRVLGENNETTLRMRTIYAAAFYMDAGATLDDLREAVTTLEVVERAARRVLGGAHPDSVWIQKSLRNARTVLRARETPPGAR